MYIFIALAGFFIFVFGIVFLSDKFKPSTLSDKSIKSSPFILLILGIFLTAMCQSSSATGIVVLIFLDKGVVNLKQAGFFLVGGNIGTTLSGQVFSFSMGDLVTVLILLTIVTGVIKKKYNRFNPLFNIFLSFSCIFFGLDILKMAADHYSSRLFMLFQLIDTGPGTFFFGFITTALFQSSSLIIGILVVLVEENILQHDRAIIAALGLNIGTCSTLAMVSTGLSKKGKRGAIFHFIFNVTGIILVFMFFSQFINLVEKTSMEPARILVNAHTLFNLLTALILLPLWSVFEKLIDFIYPGK